MRLVKKLLACGVLSVGFERRCDVGAFAVAKKNGRQRLVVDARRSNLCFGPPPSVSLPTAASFARMEVPAGQKLHCVQFDLAKLELRPYFCLPGLTGAQLGISSVDGMLVGDSIMYPQFRAMPMGWSHALAWCQKLFAGLAQRAAPAVPLLADHSPTPDLVQPAMSVYVDNFAVLGLDEAAVRDVGLRVLGVTHVAGLDTHEYDESHGDFSLLGLGFDSQGRVLPKVSRLWRLWKCLLFLLRRGRVSLHQVSCLAGHFTSLALMRRKLLSIVRAGYVFIGGN